jgi:hypothetical protein
MKPSASLTRSDGNLPLAERLDSILLALLCFAMCSQVDVRHFGRDTLAEGLGFASKTFALSLSDVLFVGLLAWFLARTSQLKAWNRLWWPPLPCFALIFALVLSLVHSKTIGASIVAEHSWRTQEVKVALADIAQWVGYFGVAPWMLVNLLRDRRSPDGSVIRRENVAVGALVAAFVVSGVLALIQTQTFGGLAPRGLWSSPNLFAGFVAFTVPFLDEIEIPHPRFALVPLGLSLFCAGIVWLCVASPWAAMAAWIGLFFSWLARPNLKKLRIARLALLVFVAAFFSLTWNRNPQLRALRADEFRLASVSQKVKKRWIEWQVATRWNDPKERAFATGYGPGNYQSNIGELYQYDGIPSKEKIPPDSNNLYLVQAMSVGVLGLGALLWVLYHFWSIAWRAAQRGSWLGAAVFGSLGAWIFVNPFHALVVRGAGLVLALFFALAVAAEDNAKGEAASNDAEPNRV